MNPVFIQAVGLVAPGLFDWRHAQSTLMSKHPYRHEPVPPLKPDLLKPNERRRTSNTIKLALQAVYDALGSRAQGNDYASVFSSSEGDMEIVDRICRALDMADRPVSPTHFHHSVHNAPAGYCSIASGSQNASTSLAGLDGSFSTGLLEASVQTLIDQQPILLVTYDFPVPFPLNEAIPISTPFATALLLSADADANSNMAGLNLQILDSCAESRMTDPQLEHLRIGNPAARSLPLLQALANGEHLQLVLPYLPERNLAVEVVPC